MTIRDDLQVLVAGGGIGGVTAARALRDRGIDPVVVEAAEEWPVRDRHAILWENGCRVLEALGVGGTIRSLGRRLDRWTVRGGAGSGRRQLRVRTDERAPRVVPAPELHAVLRGSLPDRAVRLGAGLRSLERDGAAVAVRFESGVRERFDAVVGADGVGSRVRELIGAAGCRPCGTATWATPVEDWPASPDHPTDAWGRGSTLLRVVPGEGRDYACLTARVDGSPPDDPGAIGEQIDDGDPLLAALPEAVDLRCTRWRTDYRVSTDTWGDGRIALLGDAAHAMHPVAGVGDSLAIGDASVLATELVDRGDPVADRLADYAGRRRSRLRRLRHAARRGDTNGGRLAAPRGSTLAAAIPDAIAVRTHLLAGASGAAVGPRST